MAQHGHLVCHHPLTPALRLLQRGVPAVDGLEELDLACAMLSEHALHVVSPVRPAKQTHQPSLVSCELVVWGARAQAPRPHVHNEGPVEKGVELPRRTQLGGARRAELLNRRASHPCGGRVRARSTGVGKNARGAPHHHLALARRKTQELSVINHRTLLRLLVRLGRCLRDGPMRQRPLTTLSR